MGLQRFFRMPKPKLLLAGDLALEEDVILRQKRILQRCYGWFSGEFIGKIGLSAGGKADGIAVDPFTQRSTRAWTLSQNHSFYEEPCLAPHNAYNAASC